MFRAQFYFQFPQEDPTEITEHAKLGEFYSAHDNIWKALAEAREKRKPIASALMGSFPGLNYVRHSEIEIHLSYWDAQLEMFVTPTLVDGGPQPS